MGNEGKDKGTSGHSIFTSSGEMIPETPGELPCHMDDGSEMLFSALIEGLNSRRTISASGT